MFNSVYTHSWSLAENEEVWVSEFDSVTNCDGCLADFDLDEEGEVDGDDAFCQQCYEEIFG